MTTWFAEVATRLASHPWAQGLVAALCTFVLEDPTTIGCGLLVADHRMLFLTAMVGVAAGIALGDLGLYGIGRAAGPRVRAWGLVDPDRLDRAAAWFDRNLVLAMVFSRFVPGMRLPTYLGAGVLRAPFIRFTALAIAASLVWTYLLLRLTIAVGEQILPLLGRLRWPVAGLALLLLVLLQRRAARSIDAPKSGPPVFSSFELWPPWLFYIPVACYWLWLALRYRGLMLPTAANPAIYSGGFVGESKAQILDLVASDQREWLADYVVISGGADLRSRAVAALDEAGLAFPVVAKPDIGQRGAGVRPIHDEDELGCYLSCFPPGARLLLQEMVAGEAQGDEYREAGVLYWRLPGAERGAIFSVTLKLFPTVTGDGKRSVAELIRADPRASRLRSLYARRLADDLERVLAAGERLELVFAGNHCQGAVFVDGRSLVTRELEQRIQEIANAVPELYFARFDIRFEDLDTFLAGKGFKIIEINGASAEATHIWDASMGLKEAYMTLFEQFRILFQIGAANRCRGHQPIGVLRCLSDALAYWRLARTYPTTR